jgi:hypothetical protein
MPIGDLEYADWKDATLHPDCYVYIEGDYYSAPHIHRHKKLRIKITENQVEIFLGLERLAIHPRSRHRDGKRVFIDAHFPPGLPSLLHPYSIVGCCSPNAAIVAMWSSRVHLASTKVLYLLLVAAPLLHSFPETRGRVAVMTRKFSA